MEKSIKLLSLYIATLKSLALIYQSAHWLSKGNNSYSEHQLFDRLYKTALEALDDSAEKFIGLFGEEVIDYSTQAEILNLVLLKYENDAEDPSHMALVATKDFLKLSAEIYLHLEKTKELTLGLDDLIFSNSSKIEDGIYLLKQMLSE